MKGRYTLIGLVVVFVFGLLGAAFFFVNSFFSSFRPPDIKVSRDRISSNRGLVNGVEIEKLIVDSIGEQGYPVKYSTIYSTSCNIRNQIGKTPRFPNEIELYREGNYEWVQDSSLRKYRHFGLTRELLSPERKLWWLEEFGKSAVCPLDLIPNQWYFIRVGDPMVTGIYFIIDRTGKEKQYFVASGVSPI